MTLIEYLHDLGVCLHFRDDPLLKKILVLKPSWGTDAVYKVLDDRGVIERSGRFDRADLLSMWSEPEYEGMHDELLQLMLNFKICYAIPETSGAFIAPQRLSESRPQYEWRNDGNLILRYVYDFMPKGIVTQLIVAMHSFIAGSNCVWRNGVVIEKDDAFAEVIQTYAYSYKEIRVRTRGRNKKDLLTQVAYELEKIHRTYKELRYRTLIPCNCAACSIDVDPHFHSYDVLKKFSGDGEEYIQCQKSYKMVRVRSLIDDVQEITDSEEHRKRKDSTFMFTAPIQHLIIDQSGGAEIMPTANPDKVAVTSAWANGLFYVFLFTVVFILLGYFAQALPFYTMVLVIFGGILLIPLVGALQLRQDERVSERSFMELIGLVIGQLPLLSRFGSSRPDSADPRGAQTAPQRAPGTVAGESTRSRRRPTDRARPHR
jgi:hypothetical protein